MRTQADVLKARAARQTARSAEIMARRRDRRRREVLATIDEPLLGPGISARSTAVLSIEDMIAIKATYEGALERLRDGAAAWARRRSGAPSIGSGSHLKPMRMIISLKGFDSGGCDKQGLGSMIRSRNTP